MSSQAPTISGGAVWHRNAPANKLGESPLYRSSDSTLHWIDMYSTPCELHILPIHPTTNTPLGPTRILKISKPLTCIYFRKGEPGYVCGLRNGIGVLDEETGELSVVRVFEGTGEGEGEVWCNDGGVDPQGRFWIGEVDLEVVGRALRGEAYGVARGRLWRFDGRNGELRVMEAGVGCGNGIGWSKDGKRMFFNDSVTQRVSRYDFDGETGNISNRKDIISGLDNGKVRQGLMNDGMVLDLNNNLWIAIWMDHSINVYSSDGTLLKKIVFPAKCITCPTWGGKDFDTLFVTSAQPLVEKAAEGDEGGHLFMYRELGVKGLAKHEFIGKPELVGKFEAALGCL